VPAADFTIWLLCAAFYLADNIRLLKPREILLTQMFGGNWALLFPLSNYRIAGHTLSMTNPLLPFLAAYRMAWLCPQASSAAALGRIGRRLQVHRARLWALRWLSSALFLALFVLAPLATHLVGLGVALLLALAAHLAALLVALLVLASRRRQLRIGWLQIAGVILEYAVCPGFFVNIYRRTLLNWIRVPGDAVAYVLQAAPGGSTAAVEAGIERGLSELESNGELHAGDDAAIEAYRRHLTGSRSA
jgi:hypothetical protein